MRTILNKMIAVALVALLAACALVGCAAPGYVSPYDWAALQRDGEHLAYAPDGVVESRWGIDVSAHQLKIEWPQVAEAGVQFAFVRVGNRGATEGVLYEDASFMANATGAQSAGIPVSAYFFSQAVTVEEAEEEAAFALAALARAEEAGVTFETVAYDHEPVNVEGARANALDGEQLSAMAIAFCEKVQAAGYAPLIYGNQRDIARYGKTVSQAYPMWLAEYETEVPTAQFDFQIWQYSNTGSIPGISTEVDLNIWLPSIESLKR